MKKLALTVTVLAILSGPAFAQGGFEMLQNNVANSLRTVVPDADLSNVTLGEMALIKSILDSDDTNDQQRIKIEHIIEQADAG